MYKKSKQWRFASLSSSSSLNFKYELFTYRSLYIIIFGQIWAPKGTNLTRTGKYSSTLADRLRARASSNQYSLVRPFLYPINGKYWLFLTKANDIDNYIIEQIKEGPIQ